MTRRHARLTFALASCLFLHGITLAQDQDKDKPSEILPGRPDADVDTSGDLLGAEFESKGHGISLRPPKGSVPIRRVGAKDFVEFVDEARGWTLKLSKIKLDKPGTLTEAPDAHGVMQPGLLEFTAKRLKEELPDAEFLRKEKINIADGDVGLLALRYTRGLKPLLSQQAIVQKTDQLYYLIALTTPGAPQAEAGAAAAAAAAATSERAAAEAFRQILDSVKLLDLAAVREDQDKRLFSTRGLLLNFQPERLRAVLAKPAEGDEYGKRWLRILKNGKDIGYTYVMERTTIKGNQEGIEVRVRTRVRPSPDAQVDVGSIMHSSMDLRHEDWSSLTEFANVKQRAKAPKEYKPPQIAEFGVSDRRSVPGQGDVFTLQVLYESTLGERVEPVQRGLPPFYLPQAISHLLPRLLPTGDPKTFMFMVFQPETREVVMRYVDVLAARKVEFNHQNLRAVPIEDRMGLEGSVTTHYVSSDHVWLGSENKETGITVVPSDEKTLLNLWKDANLEQPEAPEQKNNPKQRAAGQEVPESATTATPARR